MKNPRLILLGTILLSFAGSYALQRWLPETAQKQSLKKRTSRVSQLHTDAGPYRRIVSLAPSITEVLFALGLGEKVVGVTRFCDYPPEALTKAQVGGYYDPSYETILAVQPDLVVTLPEHGQVKKQLHQLGLETLDVDHRTASGIVASIAKIGEACGVTAEAEEFSANLRGRVRAIQHKVAELERPRVLVSIGRQVDEGSLRRVTACGTGGFYDDLIRIVGGENAYSGAASYPRISGEGILAINPDVIVDLVPELAEQPRSAEDLVAEWAVLPGLSAVKKRRVYVLGGDHLIVPGPRFILLLEELARAVHPEVPWDQK